MKRSARNVLLVVLVLTSSELFRIDASAEIMNAPFRRRGVSGGRYCTREGGICLKAMALGEVESDCAIIDVGNVDVAVANGDELHLVFYCGLGNEGVVPVDSATVLSPEVSNALGYDVVTVLEGMYPVDYSRYPHGEAFVTAVFESPTPIASASWGVIKSHFRTSR